MTDTSIGEITGTTTTTQTLNNLKMTVVDASGYTVLSAAFSWTVKATVVIRNVATPAFCGVAGSNYLAAGACSSGPQLTYLASGLLQVTSAPTLCLKAVAGTPATTGATCDATSGAQQWDFNSNGSIPNVF